MIEENTKQNNIIQYRQSFLDILRVVATCAVVLLHTLTGTVDAVDINQYPFERIVFLVMMDLITWCVPIFVLISGYLFLNPRKSFFFPLMLKKYCRRIVLALLLFGVPYAVIELVLVERTFRLSMLGQGVLMVLQGKSWSHMWYLYLILLLYLLTPAMKWLLARMPKVCLYTLLAMLLLASSILPFLNKLLGLSMAVLPDGGIYFFYYLCGYLFACKEGQQDNKKAETANYAAAAVIVLVLVGMALSRILGNFSVQMAYNYPFTVLISVLAFKVCRDGKYRLQEKTATAWRKVSNLTFAIYLVHPVFVNILYKFLNISLLDFPIGISLPLFFAVILLLAIIAAWILCRIPLLKKYVL